jgi:hypothetical protein
MEIRKQIETTVRLEQDRVASEVDALQKSIGVELRLHIAIALVVYGRLSGLGFMPNAAITAKMVERHARIAAPLIYPASAGKIVREQSFPTCSENPAVDRCPATGGIDRLCSLMGQGGCSSWVSTPWGMPVFSPRSGSA